MGSKQVTLMTVGAILTGGALILVPPSVWADDDIEGQIQSVNPSNQSFVVQGITFHATAFTEYDDGLRSFTDLASGQYISVDFQYRNGKHYATEVELDD